MALQSGAFERLREFSSPGVLSRTLLLHVARGYSLRETVVRAKLAHWADVSDVALLKRLRKSVHELGGGASGVAFEYRIMALRRGYENVRLEDKTEMTAKFKAGLPTPSATPGPPLTRPALPKLPTVPQPTVHPNQGVAMPAKLAAAGITK